MRHAATVSRARPDLRWLDLVHLPGEGHSKTCPQGWRRGSSHTRTRCDSQMLLSRCHASACCRASFGARARALARSATLALLHSCAAPLRSAISSSPHLPHLSVRHGAISPRLAATRRMVRTTLLPRRCRRTPCHTAAVRAATTTVRCCAAMHRCRCNPTRARSSHTRSSTPPTAGLPSSLLDKEGRFLKQLQVWFRRVVLEGLRSCAAGGRVVAYQLLFRLAAVTHFPPAAPPLFKPQAGERGEREQRFYARIEALRGGGADGDGNPSTSGRGEDDDALRPLCRWIPRSCEWSLGCLGAREGVLGMVCWLVAVTLATVPIDVVAQLCISLLAHPPKQTRCNHRLLTQSGCAPWRATPTSRSKTSRRAIRGRACSTPSSGCARGTLGLRRS